MHREYFMRFFYAIIQLFIFVLLSGCTSPAGKGQHPMVSLPLNTAWMDGHKVEYVTTDISDKVMAQAMGVNYVPRLADAIPSLGNRSLVERVYKFVDGSQDSVFQSAPSPTGSNNVDKSYSPLWRLVNVRKVKATSTNVLVSEEEILRAVDANEVALEITHIVINCPITRSVDGRTLDSGN